MELDDFSYKNGDSSGKIQIKSLSDEGFLKYLSKDSYSRLYLNKKFAFLNNQYKDKLEESKNSESIYQNKG